MRHDLTSLEARVAFELDPARYRDKRANMIGGDLLKDTVGLVGGTRPKINAQADDGSLWIVELPKFDDQCSAAHAEVLALTLASAVGIETAEARLLPSSRKEHNGPHAIIKRFDRLDDGTKVPFISGQTFMKLPGASLGIYPDMACGMVE